MFILLVLLFKLLANQINNALNVNHRFLQFNISANANVARTGKFGGYNFR